MRKGNVKRLWHRYPYSVTFNGNVKKPNDIAESRNGHRYLNPHESPHTPLWKRGAEGDFKGGMGGLLLLTFCSMLFALSSLLFCCSSAFADGLSGWLNLNYSTTEQFEDGKKTSTSDSLLQNYYLNYGRAITPILSYQLYLRTSLSDSHSTDSEDKTTSTYQRAIEPALDISLRNPMYGLNAGYRRLEQWSTAQLSDKSRKTTEYYYTRFDVTPYELPSLYLQFDRQRNYDYLSPVETDTTNTTYSASSAYTYSYSELNLSYNLTYMHSINETPIGTVSKSINDNFNGSYNVGYNKSFWSGKVNVSAGYQGNYSWNKSEQSVAETGEVIFERMPFGGIYALGTTLQPNVDEALPSLGSLVDNNFNTGITEINIGTKEFHNIGIWVSSEKSVDRLYIYVNKDVTPDTNLTNVSNWEVYKSNINSIGTWTEEISIQSVTVSAYDTLNNIYRYEIMFSTSQNASYFKVINMKTVNAFGITDVLVTEIEAYGTDEVPETGKLTDTSTFFTQGLNLNANVRATNNLSFSFGYFINRADQSPRSVIDSIGGIFTNIFSKTKSDQDEKLTSNVTKSYSASSTWVPHRLLTTTLRFSRSKAFDNKGEIDVSSNTYSLSFSSSPLPTLDTTLSLNKNDSYSFDEKQTTSDSYLLTVGSKLYRDLNMTTDIGYTQSKSYTESTQSSTSFINGTLDAHLTNKLYGSLTYGLSWTSSDGSSSSLKSGSMIITYIPGRFINLSGSLQVSDTDGDTSATEGLSMDWLPLPAIRLNLSYQHNSTEPGPSVSDSLSGYGIWYITKFMEVQLTYNYKHEANEKKAESYNFGGNLTCRF
ncbi:MAG: hypothetical protein AB1480_08910 [Nitrospirota bacterium]